MRGRKAFFAVIGSLLVLLWAMPLFAQETSGEDQDDNIKLISVDPSLTGETGIIATLTADTLQKGTFAFGFSYHNWDRELTDFDVNQWAATFAYGVTNDLEISASLIAIEQIAFSQPPSTAVFPPHVLTSFPFPISTIEEGLGDLYVGAKYSFIQGSDTMPGFAVRAFAKFPMGDETEGFGSGATDFGADFIVSQNFGDSFLLTGNVGLTMLGTPDAYSNYDFGNNLRWGVGSKIFVNPNFRLVGELTGTEPMGDDDFPQGNNIDLLMGIEYKWDGGLRFGIGYTRALVFDEPAEDPNGGYMMLSWSPWREKKLPKPETPPPPPPTTEEPPPPPPTTEEPPPPPPPPLPQPELIKPVDVYFDFDSSDLRPESVEFLNKLIDNMNELPDSTLVIEGHCCYIGTEEYNLALGEARANSIRNYLIEKGIDTNRIKTVSYGEANPLYDNSKEETRQLNRRGHFLLSLQ